jgi:hypothetical protein
MKNLFLTLLLVGGIVMISCKKETTTQRFDYLTGVTWVSDSLLANGEDASEPGEILAKFKGEIIFNEDGTGVFGVYTGTWTFAYNETQILIDSDSLPLRLTTQIVELTASSLKITTEYPDLTNSSNTIYIRMTFNPK